MVRSASARYTGHMSSREKISSDAIDLTEVRRMAARMARAQGVRCAADVDDIANEAIWRLYKAHARGGLRDRAAIPGWMHTTVRRLVIDLVRSGRAERAAIQSAGELVPLSARSAPDELVIALDRARAARSGTGAVATALGAWLDDTGAGYAPVEALTIVLWTWSHLSRERPRAAWRDSLRKGSSKVAFATLVEPALDILEAHAGEIRDAEIAVAIKAVLPASRTSGASVRASRHLARRKLRTELHVESVDVWLDAFAGPAA